ncbi:MAG: LytTR family transcriptional regulator DNA-binding domain-containing protein [Ruminococcus sp.]|nr:LytTR family transcriptional regulator DNA-binding domain-containing protein [Ruminococcus sp.]
MEIKLIENKTLKSPIITIECKEADEKILDMIHMIKSIDAKGKRIVGIKGNDTYCIEPEDVLYIESLERKTFCYTAKSVYETELKLYELEDFPRVDFMRVSKSCVVNLNRIKSIRPDFGGKILATMQNGEKLYVSRQYANKLKIKLGIGGNK